MRLFLTRRWKHSETNSVFGLAELRGHRDPRNPIYLTIEDGF